MSWKTIATFITDTEHDRMAVDAALRFAAENDAALEVYCLGVDHTQPDVFVSGAYAVALPDALLEAENQASRLEAVVRAQLADATVPWTVTTLITPIVGLTPAVADAARFADLVVVPKPYGDNAPAAADQVLEAALFGGRAVVLVVPDWGMTTKFDRIAVAWNDGPESLDAAKAALPLLKKADATDIIIVDPSGRAPDRSDPGGRLCRMLTRHGVKAEVTVLPKNGSTVAEVLTKRALVTNAGLLVMGAYGHSRLREAILGGATRDVLAKTTLPVLMVH